MAGPIRRLINRSRPAALGLRRRILLIITLGSIALSLFLATTTFGLTRSSLVTERDEVAIDNSRRNALAVYRDLRPTLPPDPATALRSLEIAGVQRYMIWYKDSQYGTSPFTRDNIPPELFERVVTDGESARQKDMGNFLHRKFFKNIMMSSFFNAANKMTLIQLPLVK